jgi:hypothetical protein
MTPRNRLQRLGARLGTLALAGACALASAAPQPGESALYTLDYSNQASNNLQPLMDEARRTSQTRGAAAATPGSGLERQVQASVQGTATITTLLRQIDGTLHRLQMPAARVSLVVDGQEATTEEGLVSQALANGLLYATGPNGQIRKLWLPPQTGAVVKGVVKAVLALTQVVSVEDAPGPAASWQVNETDHTGTYQVRYSRLAPEGPLSVLQKQKLNFVPALDAGKATRSFRSAQYLPTGSLRLTLDTASSQLRSINGTESHDVLIDDQRTGHSDTRFAMTWQRNATLSAQALVTQQKQAQAQLAVTNPGSLLAAPTREESDTLLYRQKLGTATLATLTAQLNLLNKGQPLAGSPTDLYQKLKALIYLQPATSTALAKGLAAKSLNQPGFKLVINALSTVGSPTAQTALAQVIKARQRDKNAMVQLIPVLGMLEQPTSATQDLLRSLALDNSDEDVSSTAQLALSIVARTLSADDPAHAQALLAEVLAHLGHPQDVPAVQKQLLLIGNAALPKYLSMALGFANDPRDEVRSDAMMALRFYPVGQVGPRLVQALRADADATTRRDAATALGFMAAEDQVIAALQAAYAAEPVPEIRLVVIKSLWRFERARPAVRALVRQAALSDPSDEVRKGLKSLMNSRPPEYFQTAP